MDHVTHKMMIVIVMTVARIDNIQIYNQHCSMMAMVTVVMTAPTNRGYL